MRHDISRFVMQSRLPVDSLAALPATAIVSTFPPSHCGIAEYSASLVNALAARANGNKITIVPIADPDRRMDEGIVRGEIGTYRSAAEYISRAGVACVLVEHEFGLYGDYDGSYRDFSKELYSNISVPLITTLHTVPDNPSDAIRLALCNIIARSSLLTVMTPSAREQLINVYEADRRQVHVVPHGTSMVTRAAREKIRRQFGIEDRKVIGLYGFIEPRKGAEFLLEHLPAVMDCVPDAVLMIVGEPRDPAYLQQLSDLAAGCPAGSVRIVPDYPPLAYFGEIVRAADVCVTPYPALDQASSGMLVTALGAARAVVSSPYTHAIDLAAMCDAVAVRSLDWRFIQEVIHLLKDDGERRRRERQAETYARRTTWEAIAAQLAALMASTTGY